MRASERPSQADAQGKMQSIEACRALAALVVVLMHAANMMNVPHFSGRVGFGGLFDFGYVGVDFFFVLSGFIITYVHFADIGNAHRIPVYLWRRFMRIFPIYWIILALVITLTASFRILSGQEFMLELSLTDIFLLKLNDIDPKYIGVAWSLHYEVIFYAAFCLLMINARLGTAVFTAWGVFVVLRACGFLATELPFSFHSAHCLQFLCGIIVGVAARRHALRASLAWLLPGIGVALVTILFEVYGPLGQHTATGRILLGLSFAALLAILVALENTNSLSTPRWLVEMGSVSYSIYLGHILFISMTYTLLLKAGLYHRLPEPLVFTLAITLALTGTLMIGRFVELPLIRAFKNIGRGKPAPVTIGQKV